MMLYTVLGLVSASIVAAQSTTSLCIPGFENQQLVAFVVGSDATAATYAVNCIPRNAEESSACGGDNVIVTAGPSTVAYTITTPGFTETVECSLTGVPATGGVCTYTTIQSNENGILVTTLAPADIMYQSVILLPLASGSSSSSARPVSIAVTITSTLGAQSATTGKTASIAGSVTETTTTTTAAPIQTVATASQNTGVTSSSRSGADQANVSEMVICILCGVAAVAAMALL